MNLPSAITTRLETATEKEIAAIKSLANLAKQVQDARERAWSEYRSLKDREPLRAGLLARALNSYSAGQDEARERFALAQILCLVGGGIQRGAVSDGDVFASEGAKGDAEWTARARANVGEIVSYIARRPIAA